MVYLKKFTQNVYYTDDKSVNSIQKYKVENSFHFDDFVKEFINIFFLFSM